jgi:hypothetical protein
MSNTKKSSAKGKLKIGDDWNAITIIALSQNNPLKAIAEFVENSIDAQAQHITLFRSREHADLYLRIVDDGQGIPKDEEGIPNFKYVATHICDSIKRQLKQKGLQGLQGEFGIGLLSFWTVGEKLRLISPGEDGNTYVMHMEKGNPGYSISHRKLLVNRQGTELVIGPLLPGTRLINGEKIQRYLASELRDRIRKSGVQITVIDRVARKSLKVEPRQFDGQLLHHLTPIASGENEIYLELYLAPPSQENMVGLYRHGTRVLDNLARLQGFDIPPWDQGCLQGIVDAPFLNITPGTRDGIILDENFAAFHQAMAGLSTELQEFISQQRKQEEEATSRQMLRSVQSALKEALLRLPPEEYDWFNLHKEGQGVKSGSGPDGDSAGTDSATVAGNETEAGSENETAVAEEDKRQKAFFEFPGPLSKAYISPAACVMAVDSERNFRALARDRANKSISSGLHYTWEIVEGGGTMADAGQEILRFKAPSEPGITRIKLVVSQAEAVREAEAIITVTDQLFAAPTQALREQKGLPAYTLLGAPGELWRSRYDKMANIITINSSHKDYLYCKNNRALKIRYFCRLFAKELILENFPGVQTEQLLERLIELTLYMEEQL